MVFKKIASKRWRMKIFTWQYFSPISNYSGFEFHPLDWNAFEIWRFTRESSEIKVDSRTKARFNGFEFSLFFLPSRGVSKCFIKCRKVKIVLQFHEGTKGAGRQGGKEARRQAAEVLWVNEKPKRLVSLCERKLDSQITGKDLINVVKILSSFRLVGSIYLYILFSLRSATFHHPLSSRPANFAPFNIFSSRTNIGLGNSWVNNWPDEAWRRNIQ